MRFIHKYIPTKEDGSVVRTICSGDGAVYERMKFAQRAVVSQSTPQDKLCGIVQSPGEFHAEGLDLQVC